MFRPRYYSQLGEDQHIYKKYFSGVRNGTFLEMGALDGVLYSNTKMFEDVLGWSGVLIEPIPDAFARLQKNRPGCKLFQAAVSAHEGTLDIYSHGAVSSVKENTTHGFFNGWHAGRNIPVLSVPSRRLDSILHEAGIKRIDFWSLDVEGSELDVLQTMDWSIPVYLLCIETQTPDKKPACDQILSAHGLVFVETFHHNEIWINLKAKRH